MSKKRKKQGNGEKWFMNSLAMVQYPRLKGEKSDRIVSPYYQEYVMEHPVDFAVIPELLQLAQHEHLADVRTHLEDAANEELPMQARVQHFDIAGSKMWNICFVESDPFCLQGVLAQFIHLWKNAGGI